LPGSLQTIPVKVWDFQAGAAAHKRRGQGKREGLLDPARSAGGTRRYSRRNIGRLQEIRVLTADGLNLAGIRRVLQLQEETRQLQAAVARLRELAGGRPAPAERSRKQRSRRAAEG
jgi:DNA-binding transcriptional MerR regulator